MTEVFEEYQLERFDQGHLTEHQIYMMLINAIKNLEATVNRIDHDLSEVNGLR